MTNLTAAQKHKMIEDRRAKLVLSLKQDLATWDKMDWPLDKMLNRKKQIESALAEIEKGDHRETDFVFVGEWTEEEKMKKRQQIYALINRELIPYDSKMVIEKEKI